VGSFISNVFPIEYHLAGIRSDYASDEIKNSGLTGAVRSDETYYLTLFHFNRKLVNSAQATEIFR
jgi:hypothetical protein